MKRKKQERKGNIRRKQKKKVDCFKKFYKSWGLQDGAVLRETSQGGPLENSIFQTQQDNPTHKLTAPVTACTRPAQDQVS